MYQTQQNNSFSMFFGHRGYEEGEIYSYNATSSPSSSVDCTLSLGTPSTRLSNENNHHEKKSSHHFGWNILSSSKHSSSPSAAKSHRAGGNVNGSSGGGDPLLARRCANCDTTSTPLWRNGPRGPKSLCNACGIRYKKEERRATAAAVTSNGGSATYGSNVDSQYENWVQPQKMPCYSSTYGNEFRFVEDDDHRDSVYSWRFNVADRPSLVHDFTR